MVKRIYNKNPMKDDCSIQGPKGITLRYIEGVQVYFPPSEDTYRVRVTNCDSGAVFTYDVKCNKYDICKVKVNYTWRINWLVEVLQDGKLIFRHKLDLAGKRVLINMSGVALGDSIAWMSAVLAFQEINHCDVDVVLRPSLIPLFSSALPNIRFVEYKDVKAATYHAVYPVGIWTDQYHHPHKYPIQTFIGHAARILGVPDYMCHVTPLAEATRDCSLEYGRYVCIATRASRKYKQWNNPTGWHDVAAWLLARGYRVLCIDADNKEMPPNAEDFTGKLPLRNRIDLIRGCAFFIGTMSGLSWISWACGKPTVVIGNYSRPDYEFITPYRITDTSVCHACYHECFMNWQGFEGCPKKADYICSRVITAQKVIDTIQTIPGVEETNA